ncbi:MAG: HAMP domain-containing protein, partial [Actinobacteria bacterium]
MAAAFAVAMALVLAGTGAYVYAKLGSDLSHALDQDLRVRAQDLSALVAGGGSLAGESAGRLVERGESFGQVISSRGTVVDASRPLGGRPLLDRSELRRVLKGSFFVDRGSVPGLNEPARFLATPVRRHGGRAVLAVGATKGTKLLVAGPVALVLAVVLGYLLAGTGLRAVEVMRRRAAEISADRRGERLPVPASGDELERLGSTLNEMLARLEAALERERDFVAEAGHELRTPLALLRAELDFALHHADSETELREALREASAETDRLVQLAGDLLLIASSDREGLSLRLET